ncbi:stabilizer of axonemal microtubules 1 isoform X4 [Hypanus sabinus]|uniref:stabilizer of axonemal microtubules 1 isoform X4 n=1 Tax=Hypanus sabinus TaxID=79690 RepID=UPI0028C418B1|nr:stabilizer of axonemal microtubules 1 isoform X4 [Hypanus sabinus]
MALNYLKKIEDLEFLEFSCLCELCDCGQHKCHQNCKKNQSNQQRSVNTDWLLTNYQSSFTRPLNVLPRSSKRPLRTPPHPNPPAMQCETTQRLEFGPKVLKEWKQAGNRPLPFEKQHTGSKKRPKAKPTPMDLLSSYRKDFPEHHQPKMNLIIPAQDNLQVNRHLPTDFNTIQRNSYIGWDTTRYPRPDPIKYKDELSVGDGLIESETVTQGRIESTSVTGRDFTPKNVCEPMYSAKQQKNTPGHREACSSMPFPMCKLQAYLIHQHFKKMKISNRAVPITCTQ